ncbi:hypothetical protein Scep_004476 [Stephania cephalantha]|uniref:Glabrous enhancer-binding protein-like DBD domain-containing protein n=1 Tax=Stephania cephalantha TaxID=152367 RepID=A0AAP0KSJ0_9MAGN
MAENEDSNNATMLTTCLMNHQNKVLESDGEKKERKNDNVTITVSNENEGCGRYLVIALSLDMSNKLFPNIWEKVDETVILQGLIDFIENGGDPFVDVVEFLKTIKDSFHFSPTVKHLIVKTRKLNTKYQNMAKKEKEGEGGYYDLKGLDMNLFVAQFDLRRKVLKGENDSLEKRKLLVDDAKAYLKWIDG